MRFFNLKCTIWSNIIRTDFNEIFLYVRLKRSSREGPSKSMTITFLPPSNPQKYRFGIPAEKEKIKSLIGKDEKVQQWIVSRQNECTFPLECLEYLCFESKLRVFCLAVFLK